MIPTDYLYISWQRTHYVSFMSWCVRMNLRLRKRFGFFPSLLQEKTFFIWLTAHLSGHIEYIHISGCRNPTVHPVRPSVRPTVATPGSRRECQRVKAAGTGKGQSSWFRSCLSLQTVGKSAAVRWAHVFDITVTCRLSRENGNVRERRSRPDPKHLGKPKNTFTPHCRSWEFALRKYTTSQSNTLALLLSALFSFSSHVFLAYNIFF